MGLVESNWRSGLQPQISNLRILPAGSTDTGSRPAQTGSQLPLRKLPSDRGMTPGGRACAHGPGAVCRIRRIRAAFPVPPKPCADCGQACNDRDPVVARRRRRQDDQPGICKLCHGVLLVLRQRPLSPARPRNGLGASGAGAPHGRRAPALPLYSRHKSSRIFKVVHGLLCANSGHSWRLGERIKSTAKRPLGPWARARTVA